jgi:hypothetical protein
LTFVEALQKASIIKYEKLKNDIALDMVTYGSLHVVRILGAIIMGNDMFLPNQELMKLISKLDSNNIDNDLLKNYKESLEFFEKVLIENQKQFTSVANFTKNTTLQSLLNKKIDLMFNPNQSLMKTNTSQKKPEKSRTPKKRKIIKKNKSQLS